MSTTPEEDHTDAGWYYTTVNLYSIAGPPVPQDVSINHNSSCYFCIRIVIYNKTGVDKRMSCQTGEGWYDDCTNYLPTIVLSDQTISSNDELLVPSSLHASPVWRTLLFVDTGHEQNERRTKWDCVCVAIDVIITVWIVACCINFIISRVKLIVERSETVCVLQLTSKYWHYYHCNPFVTTVVMVVKSFIYQFTMTPLLYSCQGGSNGGQIIHLLLL